MKKKYKIAIIISLAFFVVLSILFLIKKNKDKKDDNVKIVIVNGLSVNYLDGDNIKASVKKDNIYNFSITNDSDSEKYYKVEIDNFKGNENIKYQLSSEETKLNIDDGSFSTNSIVEYAVINPGDTHNYVLKINKSIQNKDIGQLIVEKYTFEQQYFAQTVIANSTVSQEPKTSVGTEISQADEGLIQDLDDDGVTYYFRGNIQNNYVKFADMLWRIVRINGNNTVKLILNDAADELTEYYIDNSNNYFAYSNTNIKNYLTNFIYLINFCPNIKF